MGVKMPPSKLPNQRSLIKTYVIWLFGGFFGFHHLYLRRDRHAFLWWATLGGYFGFGWLIDLFLIPRYVRDANEDPIFLKEFIGKLYEHRKPPFSTNRFIGAIMIGYLWGQLISLAIPDIEICGIDWTYCHWFIPLGVALGVWTVGNVGREKGVLWHSIIGAYLIYPLRYFLYDESYWFTALAFGTALIFDQFSKEWQRDVPRHKSFKKRFITLSSAATIYLFLWGSYFYFNGKIKMDDGEEVPIYEAIQNMLTSPVWQDFKEVVSELWKFGQHHGWYELWNKLMRELDVGGEKNALIVLGLPPTASNKEIGARFRALSLQYHPDKIKDKSQAKEKLERFMEIKQAYDRLTKKSKPKYDKVTVETADTL